MLKYLTNNDKLRRILKDYPLATVQQLETISLTPGPPGVEGILGQTGPTGDTGAQGPQGVPGPAPSGTGYVRVTDGVLDVPSLSLVIESRTDDPSTPAVGQMWLRTDL